ncbi:CDP-diacylglycerol--glycerol-3-phosphate 3-phosphatidyltransferase [Sulfurivermis fontis]|uniref:CDP-diacylglycerol--glycerol-3-phosphate 3-phosphatidyltransferase n=1 Tax=Sulfurivermis fontis TaxID=1972068 RepID=UPI000FD7427D|nr:CDP-diacylglycerol--glycerol-3-phosphate 3-phosphatidyltransferase [Sulfurivermis fontis]
MLNIPNSLTLLRIALIPVFVLFFYLPVGWSHLITTAIFALAAATDWLDGYLARRLGATSAFGAFLDPVADKLMVATALVLLVDRNPTDYHGILMALPAAIIVGREITISALREWMAEVGATRKVAVNYIGKVKTTAQMVALLLLLYRKPLYGIDAAELGFWLLYVAAVLTLWSMTVYLMAAWPVLLDGKKTAADEQKGA